MPRVISGKFRGTILKTPKGLITRPTSDKVKESLFNIISSKLVGSNFLDLFAGSGQMGIESLSRGGDFSLFIDNEFESIDCIKANLKKTGLNDKSTVIKSDFTAALSSLNNNIKFDIVYIDPPYARAMELFNQAVCTILSRNLLSKTAIVVLEHSVKDLSPDNVINLQLKRRCKYGTVMISFYEQCSLDNENCSTEDHTINEDICISRHL